MLWRYIMVVSAAVGAIQGILLLELPESPKYLVSMGDKEAARNSLAKLRGPTGDIEDEIRGILRRSRTWYINLICFITSESEPLTGPEEVNKVTVKEFITKQEHRKAALGVCGLMLAQQMLGMAP